jgi:hypothetical protein
MPSPTTALQIMRGALGLTNAVGTDQTLTADEITDCLAKFNDLVEDFSTQSLAVYGQANQTFNTVAGQAVYTIGVGGNWNTARPVRIDQPAYSTINGVTFQCESIGQEEYNLISYKAQPQEFPNFYLYVNDYPLGLVTLWPVPNSVTPITFSIDRVLSQVAAAGTSISFPPGYAKAFTYKLGVELAPLFGKKISEYPDVVAIAQETFGNIKRANKKISVQRFDPMFSGNSRAWRNWRLG